MTAEEFTALRDLPGKVIVDDIRWVPASGLAGNLAFRDVTVRNSLDLAVSLNGLFKPILDAVTFNFTLEGTGPICRIDVNGTAHGEAGRTHKHDLCSEDDPRRNLPNATPRLDLIGKSPRQIWNDICTRANIQHTGRFFDPT